MPKGIWKNPRKKIKRAFSRHKTYEEVRDQCKAQGLELNDTRYHEGGDYLVVRGGGGHAVYSTFNGTFFGKTPNGVMFRSQELTHDSQRWMQGLLHFFLTKA